MAEFPARQVQLRLLEETGRAELERVRGFIASSTLREALRLVVDEAAGEVRLHIPHYWAEYYHDGRGAFGPRDARFLVFFANPRDDPRAPTPERAAQVRHLTRDEYIAGVEENAIRRLEGREPFMFVVRSVGPAGAHPFFEEAARQAAEINGPRIAQEFDREIQSWLDTDQDVRAERKSASGRIG